MAIMVNVLPSGDVAAAWMAAATGVLNLEPPQAADSPEQVQT